MVGKIQLIARIILGLIYFVFGGMGLMIALGVMQMPQNQVMPEAAMGFMKGIMGTGYFFPTLKITETLCGLLLLTGIAAPLALVILAPVTLQIIMFHVFLTPDTKELMLPVVMGVTHVLAITGYWDLYKPLFGKKK
jgi:putative oxidoreductase